MGAHRYNVCYQGAEKRVPELAVSAGRGAAKAGKDFDLPRRVLNGAGSISSADKGNWSPGPGGLTGTAEQILHTIDEYVIDEYVESGVDYFSLNFHLMELKSSSTSLGKRSSRR